MLILAVQLVLFAHLTWIGLYLLSRSWQRWSGKGIGGALCTLAIGVAYASVSDGGGPSIDPAVGPTFISIGLLATGAMGLAGWTSDRHQFLRRPDVIFVIVGLFPALVVSLLARSYDFGVPTGVLVALGIVYLAIGVLVSRHIAREEGEAFLPDFVRSYDYSFLISVLFGGQVVLAMWIGPGATDAMILLLIGTITAAIAIQVYMDRVHGLLDRVAFANVPWLREERAELRKVEHLLPRVSMTDPLTIEEGEFSRLTRRALSHFGDLTKLATSPLTNLPEIHRRLIERSIEPTTLERAQELKVILAEAIEQLKPRTGDGYGTTDEWRFYNALYYPYVVGMRPYSTTTVHSFEDPHHHEVLEWFRTYVPERTLYNWQNAAAALIAAHLREQEEVAASPDGRPEPQLTTAG